MAKKPIKVTEVVLRDAHQSLLATRMTMDEMRPILPEMDKINYFSVECWGGATFDSCIRFLDEDPWERLRILRKGLPNTKLQMLLRGQNLLGYRPYADDVVDFFVKKAVENGIDIIRCFDALNDLRNMQTAVKATKKYGGTAEIEWTDFAAALVNDPQVCEEAAQVVDELLGEGHVVTDRELSLSGDNFAEFELYKPGAYAYLGTGNQDFPHTMITNHNGGFDVDENALVTGAGLYVGYTVARLG